MNDDSKLNTDICDHYWVPNSGLGGDPEFKTNAHFSGTPVVHAKCLRCGDRSWFTEEQWWAIPARNTDPENQGKNHE